MSHNPSKPTRVDWLFSAVSTHISDACLLYPFSLNQDGYGRLNFDGRPQLAHRVAFLIVNNHWPTPCARHTCDTPACVNPRHIIEGTQIDNIYDMISRGRKACGTGVMHAKVTDDLVRQMRREYIPRVNGTSKLGRKYGLNRKNVYNIVMRRAWKHVSS